ncbi:hypothetical protein [Rhizobium leguminosarum]|uniref:hypothetical protein n=1 Tax=Rhizobium leguminosarum TaxID=384 RepID=UPI001C93FF8B|nr:hypothetical protein [Rhizobium leguminosarum]MBY5709744.1 hypothetical protein [Rhizobium leguminosarum]
MSNRNKIIKAVAIAIGAALVLPVFFGGAPKFTDRVGGDSFRNLIYDFQTLIGGALAIGAAWWTVITMEKTDQSAAKRHTEQMELTLRKDRLAIERAVYPQAESLAGMGWYFNDIRRDIMAKNTYQKQLADIGRQFRVLKGLADDLNHLLDLEQLKEGSRLFDGMLAYKLSWLRNQATAIEEATHNAPERMHPHNVESLLGDWDGYRRIERIYSIIMNVTDEIPVIVELMFAAAEQYGVRRQLGRSVESIA